MSTVNEIAAPALIQASCSRSSSGGTITWCTLWKNGRSVKDDKGQDIFVRGTLTGWIIPLDPKTIYTQYGDWFVWMAMIGSMVFLAVAALKGRKR